MKSEEILKAIGVVEVTTRRQKAQGTRMFLYPQRRMWNSGYIEEVRFAVYESGYVRRVTPGHAANYYINKRFTTNEVYYDYLRRNHKIYEVKRPLLIHNEQHRIDYLCSYILKNYVADRKRYSIDENTRSQIKHSRRQLMRLLYGTQR